MQRNFPIRTNQRMGIFSRQGKDACKRRPEKTADKIPIAHRARQPWSCPTHRLRVREEGEEEGIDDCHTEKQQGPA